MHRSVAVGAALLFVGCSAPAAPTPTAGNKVPVVPIPTATASAEPIEEIDECPDKPVPVTGIGAGGPWVGFFAWPYNPEGASWSYSAPGLPALSKDGSRVLTYTENPLIFGESSQERLQTLRVSDEKILATRGLRFGDFRQVTAAGQDTKQIAGAYDALAQETAREIERLNTQITAEGWSSLTACRIDIRAEDTHPGCSMKNQQIRCGDWLSATYEEPRLDLSVHGKKLTLKKPGWIRPPEPSQKVEVRGCVGAAYYHPSQALLVLRMSYACQIQGADWCTQPDAWHAVKLPVAPGEDAPRAAPGSDCPAGMTAIAKGSVRIGPPDEETRQRRLADPVSVGAFCLDTREVTVADYAACVTAGRCFSPEVSRWTRPDPDTKPEAVAGCNWGVQGRDGHPMNCVSWTFAREYCAWAGKRLPTEREWQWAASGVDARKYPFGADAPTRGVCWNLDETCAAGASTLDTSPFGVLDLGGNVSEWTNSDFREHDACWIRGGFVIRGSNYQETTVDDLRAARRRYAATSSHEPWLGFRCALDRSL